MIKVGEITQEQLNEFKKAKKKVEFFKGIVKIDIKGKYEVGDTAIKVDNAIALEVYKNTFMNTEIYYVITEIIDNKTAFAYSLYPIN